MSSPARNGVRAGDQRWPMVRAEVPTIWRVQAMTENDRGQRAGVNIDGAWQDCGHGHATADEAFACPWEIEAAPAGLVWSGFVVELRAEQPRPSGRGILPWRVFTRGPGPDLRQGQLDLFARAA